MNIVEIALLTGIIAVEAGVDRVRRLGIMGIDNTPNHRVPDGDFLRVFGVTGEYEGSNINSVPPEENS